MDPTNWWISEKLDGVRAFWDGQRLYSRQKIEWNAPTWWKERESQFSRACHRQDTKDLTACSCSLLRPAEGHHSRRRAVDGEGHVLSDVANLPYNCKIGPLANLYPLSPTRLDGAPVAARTARRATRKPRSPAGRKVRSDMQGARPGRHRRFWQCGPIGICLEDAQGFHLQSQRTHEQNSVATRAQAEPD